jgi:hygromycin-B 7''-O-kinase
VPHTIETVRAIAARHGLSGEPTLLPNGGMVNEAWRIGEAILRICREEEARDEAERESLVVPLVIEAGLRTPRLIAADFSGELVPLPYTIYESASGALLGYCDFEPERLRQAYAQMGQEIARLASVAVAPETSAKLRKPDPQGVWRNLALCLARKLVSPEEGQEIAEWIETLSDRAGEPPRQALLHKDVHPWNVFVDPDRDELAAIIDWGDASWGDPAIEFATMPLQTVPAMLEGYRSAGGPWDEGLPARMLLAGLSGGLWEMRALDAVEFDRRWWRMPPGGWPELKVLAWEHFPAFAP